MRQRAQQTLVELTHRPSDRGVCDREPELVAAIVDGRWPDACDADLARHVAGCAACAEAGEIASLLRNEYAAACREAGPPPVGALWWRLEARARREALLGATRPIFWTQAVALACMIGLVLGTWPLVVDGIGDWNAALSQWTLSHSMMLADVRSTIAAWLAHLDHENIRMVLMAGVSVALLLPLVLYLALSSD